MSGGGKAGCDFFFFLNAVVIPSSGCNTYSG